MHDSTIANLRIRLCKFSGCYPAIADRFGFSYSWLGKFARGDRGKRPSFDLIEKLQAALAALEHEARASEPTHV